MKGLTHGKLNEKNVCMATEFYIINNGWCQAIQNDKASNQRIMLRT